MVKTMSCLPPMTGNGLYRRENGDDWGLVYYCFIHIIPLQLRFFRHLRAKSNLYSLFDMGYPKVLWFTMIFPFKMAMVIGGQIPVVSGCCG